jgi:hypothetical protein
MTAATTPARATASGPRLMRSWIVWTTGAEFLGFVVPASVGTLTADIGPLALPVLLVAGGIEGLILGAAQAHVLGSVLPGLSLWRWAAATSGAAMLAWLIGLLPAATDSLWRDWPLGIRLAGALVGGAVLLASIGVAQWWVLRRHVQGAGRWIAITAAAWLAGLAAFMLVAPPLWYEGQATVAAVGIGALGGLIMAAVVAVLTGVGLRTLLPPTDDRLGPAGGNRRPRGQRVNAVVGWLLHDPLLRRLVDRRVCELRFIAERSGRGVVLPVMYAERGDQIVVLVGNALSKRWWRSFLRPHPVHLWLRGEPWTGVGYVVPAGSTEHSAAREIYAAVYPRISIGSEPFVLIASGRHGWL